MTRILLACLLVATPAVADWNFEGATLSHFRRAEDSSASIRSLYSIERTESISRHHTFVELPSGSRGILSWSLEATTGTLTTRLADEQTSGWFKLKLYFGFQATGMTRWLAQEADAGPAEGADVLFRLETSEGQGLELWSPYFAQDRGREARELSTRLQLQGFEPALRNLRSPFFEELLAVTACPGTGIEELWSLHILVLAATLGDSRQPSPTCSGGPWKTTERAVFRLEDPRYEAFLKPFPSGPKHLLETSAEKP
jgi:hypothetical protein